MTEPHTLTIAEAQRLTGLGKTKLYELAQSGQVERIYKGSRNYVLVWSSLRAWLEAQPKEPT